MVMRSQSRCLSAQHLRTCTGADAPSRAAGVVVIKPLAVPYIVLQRDCSPDGSCGTTLQGTPARPATRPVAVRLSGFTLRPILVVGLGVLEWRAS